MPQTLQPTGDCVQLDMQTTIIKTKRKLNTVDGAELTYSLWHQKGGKRPVVVLLHGLGSNHTRWLELIEHSGLSDHWDIIAPDLRGHGESPYRGNISLEIWADDLHYILSREDYDKAVLIGHSLGAHAALHFYKRFSQNVTGMILIDPLSQTGFTAKMRWLWRLRLLGYLAIAFLKVCNNIGLRKPTAQRDLRDFDRQARLLIGQGKQQEMVKYYSSPWVDLKYNPLVNYLQYTYQILRPLPRFEADETEVLLLMSSGSTYSNGKIKHPVMDKFHNCTTVTIHCDHWPLTEKPEEVQNAITSWLEGIEK